jgi:HD-like signal output (HDOD) protein
MDLQQLGAGLAEHWKFPRPCQLVAGNHHQPGAMGRRQPRARDTGLRRRHAVLSRVRGVQSHRAASDDGREAPSASCRSTTPSSNATAIKLPSWWPRLR